MHLFIPFLPLTHPPSTWFTQIGQYCSTSMQVIFTVMLGIIWIVSRRVVQWSQSYKRRQKDKIWRVNRYFDYCRGSVIPCKLPSVPKGLNSAWSIQTQIVSPCLHFGECFVLGWVLKEYTVQYINILYSPSYKIKTNSTSSLQYELVKRSLSLFAKNKQAGSWFFPSVC